MVHAPVSRLAAEGAVVVFSGGQDSTTCLVWALQQFGRVEALTFHYQQRHAAEVACAQRIAEQLHVPHHVLDLGLLHQLAPSALTRPEIAIAQAPGELPNTFVDGRNLLFLTFAAIYGKQRGLRHLVTGVCQTDFSGYPDCRDVFIKSLNVTLNLAMDWEFVIHTPLMWRTKKETWALAEELGCFDLVRHATLTCYEGIPGDGCGTCPACQLRQRGMQEYLAERAAPVSQTSSTAE
ncbi:MAG: 7-cyano-7-deazaguanine synthase QueC [Alicyclobacillus sp.]|nr:7-cyano-7-deazaguanine synthase QueC [Alicyclobacillus sp.]